MRKVVVLLLSFFISLNAYSGQRIQMLIEQNQPKSFQTKIVLWANEFVGVRYGDQGPLGEGRLGKYDQDPIYRFDLFDCTTFVETVIALANSNSLVEFQKHIKKIRYIDGEVSYINRKHIMSDTWIPKNQKDGFFQDVSYMFDQKYQNSVNAVIDYGGWLRMHSVDRLKVDGSDIEKNELLKRLSKSGEVFLKKEIKMNYLSIDKLLMDPNSFEPLNPNDTYVLNIVRPNWPLKEFIGTDLLVSHQGLVFWEDGELRLVHASTEGAVKSESLIEYLSQYQQHPLVKGVSFLRITLLRSDNTF